ncbi:MAG: sulfotransferase domain-containing protein [Deltaproteobacteria bacterium]|nr:sulfotransferase domain-containing protein [Deltaproteobacteria bacterium]
MRAPDTFLVGHPRSGSGQLNGYLSRHPDIFMAKKELHFFGTDLGYHDPPRSTENYLSFFKDARGERRVGEASTWYLFSERAAQEIHDFTPSARILILLRNPLDMLHSLHSHFVFRGDEDIADFGEALAAEADRREGRRQPPYTIPAKALHYRRIADYAPQVRRYLEVFGPEQVHVILNDDFRADPRAVFRGACRFLDVDEDFPGFEEVFTPNQRARNSNRTVYSRAVQDFLVHPARQQVLEAVRPTPLPGYRFALRAMRRLNIRYVDRAPMDPELRAALARELTPEIEAIGALLGRDLSHWLAPKRKRTAEPVAQ